MYRLSSSAYIKQYTLTLASVSEESHANDVPIMARTAPFPMAKDHAEIDGQEIILPMRFRHLQCREAAEYQEELRDQ